MESRHHQTLYVLLSMLHMMSSSNLEYRKSFHNIKICMNAYKYQSIIRFYSSFWILIADIWFMYIRYVFIYIYIYISDMYIYNIYISYVYIYINTESVKYLFVFGKCFKKTTVFLKFLVLFASTILSVHNGK